MKSMVRFVRNLSLLALGLFLFSPPEALANEKLEEMLKRVSESPELQAIDAASAHTVTDAGTLKTTIADYSKLMARITGQPETQFQSQLTASIGKQGINLGLMAPMLATYDQMSALGHDAADLVSPLIARMNPEMGAILNQNYGSLTDIPDNDFGGMLQRHSDIFDLVKMPMGQLADEGRGGTAFLSGVRPVDMYARNGNPDGDDSTKPRGSFDADGANRGGSLGTYIGAGFGAIAGATAGAVVGGPAGAVTGGLRGGGLGGMVGGFIGVFVGDYISRNNPSTTPTPKEPNPQPTSSNGSGDNDPSIPSTGGEESPNDKGCEGKCPSGDDDSDSRSADPDGNDVNDTGSSGGRKTSSNNNSPVIIHNGDSTPANNDGTDSSDTRPMRDPIIITPGDVDPGYENHDAKDGIPITLPPNSGHIDPKPVEGV